MYVQFVDDPTAVNVGRRSKAGDMIGYDGNGNLLFYIKVRFCIDQSLFTPNPPLRIPH